MHVHVQTNYSLQMLIAKCHVGKSSMVNENQKNLNVKEIGWKGMVQC